MDDTIQGAPDDGDDDRNIVDASDRFATWRRQLIMSEDRKPRALIANVVTALRLAPEWRGVIRYDEFSRACMIMPPRPWIDGRDGWRPEPWSDNSDIDATVWMQKQGIYIKADQVASAVQNVAQENSFHPVKDYLADMAVRWDGEARIETMMPAIFGCEDTPLNRELFRCLMVSAVARIYEPGCKVDTVLILEGFQGARKSTAVRELFGAEWFTDDLPPIGSKDASITVGSAWCIEIAELSAMGKREVEDVKAFLSRRIDDFRPPYGRRNIKVPRQCVLVGTTNSDSYLRDETGGRRFLPVKCGAINVELLREYRDRLWGEAVGLYQLGPDEGGHWWLKDEELIAAAREQQEDRYVGDPWEPLVLEYIAGKALGGNSTTTEDIMTTCLGVSKSDLKTADLMRVAGILKRARWTRKRTRTASGRGWLWTPPEEELALPLEGGPTSESR